MRFWVFNVNLVFVKKAQLDGFGGGDFCLFSVG